MLHLGSPAMSHVHSAGFTVNFSSGLQVSELLSFSFSQFGNNFFYSFKEHFNSHDLKKKSVTFSACDLILLSF